MTVKWNIYAKYVMGLYVQYIDIYVAHIKPELTMGQRALYTYLAYITDQIWLLHGTCMFHCTRPTVVHTELKNLVSDTVTKFWT